MPRQIIPPYMVRHLLERVLGTYGTDWRIEDYGEPYEGWSGAMFFACDDGDCCLSDPINLTEDDMSLVADLYHSGTASGGTNPLDSDESTPRVKP